MVIFKNVPVKTAVIALAAVMVIVTVFVVTTGLESSLGQSLSEEDLKRPDYNDVAASLPINVYVEGEDEPINISLQIEPKQYTSEQTEKMFETVYENLQTIILGENESLDNVSSDLKLITEVEDYPLILQWYSDNYDIIDYEGSVHNRNFSEKQQENVTLTVVMEYMEYSCEYLINITVTAPHMTAQEKLELSVNEAVSQALSLANGDYVKLPTEIDGKKVTYELSNQEDSIMTFLIFAAVGVVAVIFGKRQDKKKQEEYRKKQLQYDYSELVSKLTLLMGAGMTIRKAWERIVLDYRKECERTNKYKRYVYEEMTESLNKLNAGIAEPVVYEDFGQSCNTKEYLKFASLVTQNIRKGSSDLIKQLELEAIDAFESRKNLARKCGEEAGTKLLFPMILMLGIVIAIIVIPVMMSF